MKIDAHVHVFGNSLEDVDRLIESETARGYDRFLFLSLEAYDAMAQNAIAIYIKLKRPDCYIFGSLNYRSKLDFADEVKRLRRIGFDGMKFIEQKPTERKRLGISPLDARYDEVYRFLEEEKMPALMHVGDPPEFWDENLAPDFAKENGWFYGGDDYVPLEQLYAEHETMLERYPGMTVIFAHFYFLSYRLDELERLLTKFEHLYVDLTSGTEMYFSFSKDPERTREFFLRWSDRLIYGTDNTDSKDPSDIYNTAVINRMQQAFLSDDDDIKVWD